MHRPLASRVSKEVVAVLACLVAGLVYWCTYTTAFIAEDSYFYLTTARRLALDGMQSFNGVFSTNGVHPLHFYLLAGWSWLVRQVHAGWLWSPGFAIPISFALVVIGVLNLHSVERDLGLARGLLVLPPLLLVLGLGVLYSEAHVLYCALTLWIRLAVRGEWLSSGRRAALAGLVHALVFLARLDSVFLVVASGCWAMWRERPRVGRVLIALSAFLILVGPYLASNFVFFGGLLPISGWLKSTFPHLSVRGFDGSLWSASSTLCKYNVPFGVLPLAASAAMWLGARKRLSAKVLQIGGILLVGGLGHMAYTMLFATWCGWYWYYVIPTVTGSFWLAAVIAAVRFKWLGSWLPAVAFGASLLVALFLGKPGRGREANVLGTERFLAMNRIENATLLLSEWPGAIAFGTKNSIIAADLLTANRNLYEELVGSGNAFERLFEMAQKAGRPVRYIVWHGGDFIKYDKENGELVWLDPKVSRRDRAIGRLRVGAPLAEDLAIALAIWGVQ